ncbi:hypothetical protein H632_c3933p0, partial [Helicosporidium sp. ATCC 50920]
AAARRRRSRASLSQSGRAFKDQGRRGQGVQGRRQGQNQEGLRSPAVVPRGSGSLRRGGSLPRVRGGAGGARPGGGIPPFGGPGAGVAAPQRGGRALGGDRAIDPGAASRGAAPAGLQGGRPLGAPGPRDQGARASDAPLGRARGLGPPAVQLRGQEDRGRPRVGGGLGAPFGDADAQAVAALRQARAAGRGCAGPARHARARRGLRHQRLRRLCSFLRRAAGAHPQVRDFGGARGRASGAALCRRPARHGHRAGPRRRGPGAQALAAGPQGPGRPAGEASRGSREAGAGRRAGRGPARPRLAREAPGGRGRRGGRGHLCRRRPPPLRRPSRVHHRHPRPRLGLP